MKITHPVYEDYQEQPYISPKRDLVAWERTPEKFPYQKVARKQMIRTAEGLLPGDIVMLWRISFHNFSTSTVIPNYFEYRYGVDAYASIEHLIEDGYVVQCSAKDSIASQNMTVLKRICKAHGLPKSGNRGTLEARVLDHVSEGELQEFYSERLYRITDQGRSVLGRHDAIIQDHGPKM